MEPSNLLFIIQGLHSWAVRRQYRGYEFDDALSSRALLALSNKNLMIQRVMVQAVMHFPWNIRPLLMIPRLDSTKASGFYAKGYLELFRATGEDYWQKALEDRLEWLTSHFSSQYSGKSWGNSFPFSSRGGYFPADLPTVVWTAHIGRFFLEAYQTFQKEKYLDIALDVARFIRNDLGYSTDEHGICFAYSPGNPTLIHNANLLGAAFLASVSIYRDDSFLALARSAIAWSIYHQRSDGSWSYGVGSQYDWIDNFHTAYNLDSLLYAYQAFPDIVDWRVIERGYQYWRENFFRDDGAPKYYHDRLWPLDIQCAAQSISTLVLFAEFFPHDKQIVDRVVEWTVTNMRNKDGSFMFRIHPWYRQRFASFHWGQATMIAALGAYYRYILSRGE